MITNAKGEVLVLFEGQQHWLDPNIAQDDESLRSLFKLMDANYAAATIRRSEGKAIEILPREGKKNISALDYLIAAPPQVNPAVLTLREIQRQELMLGSTESETEARIQQIETGIRQGNEWITATVQTQQYLYQSATSAIGISVGF